MTIFGWDASHFDGPLSRAILARAKAEGIAFFTHKIAEGVSDTEGGNDDTALAAARDAGIEFLGGYLIPRSNASVTTQVNVWLDLADKGEPWWHTFPGWFWQIDLERWPYDAVPAGVGIAAAQQLRERTGRLVALYASRGQYGDQLRAWDGPLWNADYVSSRPGSPQALYPDDGWAPGWAPYSGKSPDILQFTSSATIAGLTTCDANAYRGTLNQLRALVTGNTKGIDVTTADTSTATAMRIKLMYENWAPTRAQWIAAGGDPARYDALTADGSGPNQLAAVLGQILTQAQANGAGISELKATLATLTTGGLDVSALVSQIVAGVIASHDKLTDADQPTIEAAVRAVLHGA